MGLKENIVRMEPNESCWCGHQARWHRQDKTYPDLYACKWCMKMQLRRKKYCDYVHEMAREIPEWMLKQAVDALLAPTPEKRPRRTRGKGRYITGMPPPPYLSLVK